MRKSSFSEFSMVVSTNFFLKRSCFIAACVVSAAWVSTNDEAVTLSNHDVSAAITTDYVLKGSLTSCIENADVANEIEITGSSMKKAIRRVSGWVPKSLVAEEDNAKSDYCALSLV